MFLFSLLRRSSLGQSCLVSLEPAFQDLNGTAEVVAELDEQVDVVDIPRTGEAVGEVVAGVHDGLQFAAVGAEEAEGACASF